MTPQTTFADGTQTLFIGQAVFTPFRQKYDKTANERAVIYQALKQHEMRTVEEVAADINAPISRAKRLFSEMVQGGEFAIHRVWQTIETGHPKAVYTTLAANAPPEPCARLRTLMCDGRARSIQAAMKETGMTYRTVNKHLRALVLSGEFTVEGRKLANGHVASVYRMKT